MKNIILLIPFFKNLFRNKTVEIKNFVGEKLTRKINALEGVTITRGEEEKDQLWVQGISLENTSQTCNK
jgi:large subunit ribosomal protein L9e